MKLVKKYSKITVLISSCALALIFVINLFDSSLNRQTSEVLNKATYTSELEEKKCAAMLGLVVDPKLDSLSEGFKQLEQIKASTQGIGKYQRLFVPHEISKIQPKEECKTDCRYSAAERQHLKKELDKQRVFLTRFEKLMDIKEPQCQVPEVVFRSPLSGYLTLARNKILEYKLLSEVGRTKEASAGLQKMNQFFERALAAEKYTMIMGMINISILLDVREALASLIIPNKIPVEFSKFNYEDIAQHMQAGELQLNILLLKKPLDYSVFQISDINDGKDPRVNYGVTLLQSAINSLTNFFFLPNETANDMFENLQVSAWHPCIAQKDINCDMKSSNYIAWIRNPVGKSLTKLMIPNSAHTFRKLKTKLEALNKFASNKAG